MKNIYLIGFMGTGKSTVACELRRQTATILVEMDQIIEEQQRMTVAKIFEKHGETYFRDIETELLRDLGTQENLVVSCGGGCVLRDENTEIMKKSGRVVLLLAKPETVFERVRHSAHRPVLNGNMNLEYITELMEKRSGRYEAVADISVSTDGKSVPNICKEILRRL